MYEQLINTYLKTNGNFVNVYVNVYSSFGGAGNPIEIPKDYTRLASFLPSYRKMWKHYSISGSTSVNS